MVERQKNNLAESQIYLRLNVRHFSFTHLELTLEFKEKKS